MVRLWKYTKSILGVLSIFAIISCGDEETPFVEKPTINEPPKEESNEGKEEKNEVTLTATLPKFINSRLALNTEKNDGNTVVKVDWKENGESFSLIRKGENQTFNQIEKTTFSGVLPDKGGQGAYYAIYPSNSSIVNEEAVPFDFSQQTGKLDDSKTYMYAIWKEEESIAFNHLTTLLKLSLNLPTGGGTLQSLTIKGDALLVKGSFNLITGRFYVDEKVTQEVVINTSSTEQYVYLPPMAKGWELQFEAVTDAGTYIGTLSDSQNATDPGELYTPSVSLKNHNTSTNGQASKVTDTTKAATEVTGTGTTGDPFLISSAADLLWLVERANKGTCTKNPDNHYKLTTDLSIETTFWTPIGYKVACAFKGYFDGNNHTISGILKSAYIEKPDTSGGDSFGLFGCALSGEIKNLHLNAEVLGGIKNDSKAMPTGGLVGIFGGIMENCSNQSSVTGKGRTGGLVGSNTSPEQDDLDCTYSGNFEGSTGGILKSCTNEGRIKGNNYVGGVAGNAEYLDHCINKGDVIGKIQVGGVVGNLESKAISCQNTGLVTGDEDTGGVVGYIYYYVESCINKGNVTGNKNIGGVAGYFDGDKLKNCTNEGIVKGKKNAGGIVGFGSDESYDIIHNTNKGEVYGEGNTGGVVGDFNGYLLGNCHNTAVITGDGDTGGIAGRATGFLVDCTNTGDVSGIGNVGGIAGRHSGNDIGRLINKGSVVGRPNNSGNSYTGGIVGYSDNYINYTENYGTVSGATAKGDSGTGGIVGYLNDAIFNCVNKESGIITSGTGKEIYTGGLVGDAGGGDACCSCCKDESAYSENGQKILIDNGDVFNCSGNANHRKDFLVKEGSY